MSKSKNGEKILIIPKRIVTVDTANSIIKNKAVEIIDGKISSFHSYR